MDIHKKWEEMQAHVSVPYRTNEDESIIRKHIDNLSFTEEEYQELYSLFKQVYSSRVIDSPNIKTYPLEDAPYTTLDRTIYRAAMSGDVDAQDEFNDYYDEVMRTAYNTITYKDNFINFIDINRKAALQCAAYRHRRYVLGLDAHVGGMPFDEECVPMCKSLREYLQAFIHNCWRM